MQALNDHETIGSGTHPLETSDDEMAGGCTLLRRCAQGCEGEGGAVRGEGNSNVGNGKQWMVECEEVEDEDANVGAGADYGENKRDDEGDDKDVEEGWQESVGYSKVMKGKQRMVECEEVEDEDLNVGAGTGTDYSDNEEDYEDSDEEAEETDNEDEVAGGHQVLWKCGPCNTTMNIFAQDDHLRSRSHIRNARPIMEDDQLSRLPTWWCPVCDEEMTVFHQAEHLAGKQHQKMVSLYGTEDISFPQTSDIFASDEYADMPPLARSSSFELRSTFYCITCAEEFDLSEQDLHLDNNNIWVCAPCSARVHLAAREHHLNSEMHTMVTQAAEEDILCSVCEQGYKQSQKADHLAGLSHCTMLARRQFETLYLPEKKEILQRTEPQRTDCWYCDICGQDLYCEQYKNHLFWHLSTATPAPPPASANTKKKAEKKANCVLPESPLYCDVCHTYKPAKAMADHMRSKKHKKNAAANKAKRPATKAARQSQVQTANSGMAHPSCVVISGVSFYCKLCKRTRKVEGMDGHLNSKRHKKAAAA